MHRRRQSMDPMEAVRDRPNHQGGMQAGRPGRRSHAAFAVVLVGCWLAYGFAGELYMRWALWRHHDSPLTESNVIEKLTILGDSVLPVRLFNYDDVQPVAAPPVIAIARCPAVLGPRDMPEQENRLLSWVWGSILQGTEPAVVGATVDHTMASFVVVPCTPQGLAPHSHRLLVIGVKEVEGAVNGIRSADPTWPARLTTNATSVGLLGYGRCSGKPELWRGLLRQFHYVLRVHPDCRFVDNRRVFQFPLGPAVHSGFPVNPTYVHPDSTTRSVDLAFQGAVRSGRVEAVREARAVCNSRQLSCVLAPSSAHLLRQSFVAAVPRLAGQMSDSSYFSTMRDAVFTLSPAGLYPESFRTYEALALGSIPIIHNVSSAVRREGNICPFPDSHNFLRDLGAPALFVSDWTELDDVLDAFFRHPHLIRQMQERVWEWYPKFVAHWKYLILQLALHPPSLSLL